MASQSIDPFILVRLQLSWHVMELKQNLPGPEGYLYGIQDSSHLGVLCYEVEANASSLTEFRSMIMKAIWIHLVRWVFNHWDSQIPPHPRGVPSRWQVLTWFFDDLFLEQEQANSQTLWMCSKDGVFKPEQQPQYNHLIFSVLDSEPHSSSHRQSFGTLQCHAMVSQKCLWYCMVLLWLKDMVALYLWEWVHSNSRRSDSACSTGVFWGAAQATMQCMSRKQWPYTALVTPVSCIRFVTINFNRQTLHQRGRWHPLHSGYHLWFEQSWARLKLNIQLARVDFCWFAGSGHHSPIGAYDAMTDRVLVLDVARFHCSRSLCRMLRMLRMLAGINILHGGLLCQTSSRQCSPMQLGTAMNRMSLNFDQPSQVASLKQDKQVLLRVQKSRDYMSMSCSGCH